MQIPGLKRLFLILLLTVPVVSQASNCPALLDVNVRTLNEKTTVNLCQAYLGKVILIVNTASRCAYTDQYDDLEALYRKYKDRGLVILGFPSNDFGQQEPGTEAEIKAFCRLTYGVEFPMFEKTRVAKHHADTLYKNLAAQSGQYPRWNFHKYLIDRKGQFVKDFPSSVNPADPRLTRHIFEQLDSNK